MAEAACAGQEERSMGLFLRGLMELCIYPPRPRPERYQAADGSAMYSGTRAVNHTSTFSGAQQEVSSL